MVKYKKIVKVSVVFALVISILTNSVGNMFAQQEEQIEEVTTEGYESDIEEKKEVKEEGIELEKEDSSELEISEIEEIEGITGQEKQTMSYTLSKSKFQDIHLGKGAHQGEREVQTVEFTDQPLPAGANAVDLSENGDGSVIGANVNGALIITTNALGVKVKFPSDCSLLFANFEGTTVGPDGDGLVGSIWAVKTESIDLSNVDTSEVVNMKMMFTSLVKLTQLDLSSFDTSNVRNMESMFDICRDLTEINLTNFNTSNVKNMANMFGDCRALKTLDVSNFNTSKVVDMQGMFQSNNALTQLNLSNFDTSKVTNMAYMFRNCNSLTTIYAEEWDTSQVTVDADMFSGCEQVVGKSEYAITTPFDPNRIGKEVATPNNGYFTVPNLEEWNATVKYVNEDNQVVETKDFLATNKKPEITTEKLNEFMPIGYELVDEAMSLTVTQNGQVFEVEIRKIQWTLELEYQTVDGTVIKTEAIQVTQLNPVVTAQTITDRVPTGYELVTPATDWTVTANGDKKIIQVREVEWEVNLEYQTADGNVVKTEAIQVIQLNPVVTAQVITEKVPTGYELVDSATDWTATANGEKKVIQVREIEWTVSLEYQTTDGTVVKTEIIQVIQVNPIVIAQTITDRVPTGYELVDPATDWTATANGDKKIIQVREVEWEVNLEYQTADGNVVKTEAIQVIQLNPVVTAQTITEKVPTGYELVDPATDWTATANGDKKVIQVREIEWTLSLEYQTADGTVVKTETIQVTQVNPIVTAQTITDRAPTGYELVNPATDWAATVNGDKKIIQVREVEWEINLEYQTADGNVVKTEAIQVTQLNPVVTAQIITEKVPTGYELVDSATDWTATANGEKKVIQVREIEWTITIEFITENAKGIVETVTFKVGNLNPVIEVQQIMDAIPEGYYAPNEIQDLIATKDGEVFQIVVVKIEEWEGIVHFVNQNGVTIKTEIYSITNKEPMIRVEELEKALPTGAIPVNSLTELTVTKDKEEFIIEVVMPIEEEPEQPGEDDTTEEVQPEGSIEGVQTGDATQMGLWTIIVSGSIGVLAYLKRKKKSI